jgi:hypothetical protein
VQIPLDGATAAPDLRGDRHDRPALAVQDPDLLIEGVCIAMERKPGMLL